MNLAIDSRNPKLLRILIPTLLVILIVGTSAMAVYRAKRGTNAFDTFYEAGRAAMRHQTLYYAEDYYEEDVKKGPFLYPPFAACFFTLFAVFPLRLAAVLWNAVNLLLFTGSFYLMALLAEIPFKKLPVAWHDLFWFDRCLIVGVMLALLVDNLAIAQVNIFVFFLMLFSLLLVKRGHPVLAGVVMAFAVMMKVTPLIFLLFFWLKRQWKVLGGMVLGFFLAAILIPSLVLSPPKSRVAHRQFFGRIVKPIVVEWATTFRKEIPQPMKRSAEMIRYNRMVGYLSERNQSLQGSLTRLFLKDRREFSHDNPPIRVAWHYENLPVLFGGIPAAPLRGIARGIYFLILLILVYLWYPYHKKESNGLRALELTLVFLSMPLLSPWTRSHQFLSWIFALFAIINLPYLHLNGEALRHEVKLSGSPQASILIWALRVAGTLYFLQALPYGKAAGVGTWANLVFWSGFAAVIYQVKHAKICR